jgi:hypothetical protein
MSPRLSSDRRLSRTLRVDPETRFATFTSKIGLGAAERVNNKKRKETPD